MMEYSNPRMNAVIHNWPSGRKYVTATFTIEQTPGKGERAVRVTTGAPKKLTYGVKQRIVDGDDGKTYILILTMYGHLSVFQSNMQYQQEAIFENDDRYPHLKTLFVWEN